MKKFEKYLKEDMVTGDEFDDDSMISNGEIISLEFSNGERDYYIVKRSFYWSDIKGKLKSHFKANRDKLIQDFVSLGYLKSLRVDFNLDCDKFYNYINSEEK